MSNGHSPEPSASCKRLCINHLIHKMQSIDDLAVTASCLLDDLSSRGISTLLHEQIIIRAIQANDSASLQARIEYLQNRFPASLAPANELEQNLQSHNSMQASRRMNQHPTALQSQNSMHASAPASLAPAIYNSGQASPSADLQSQNSLHASAPADAVPIRRRHRPKHPTTNNFLTFAFQRGQEYYAKHRSLYGVTVKRFIDEYCDKNQGYTTNSLSVAINKDAWRKAVETDDLQSLLEYRKVPDVKCAATLRQKLAIKPEYKAMAAWCVQWVRMRDAEFRGGSATNHQVSFAALCGAWDAAARSDPTNELFSSHCTPAAAAKKCGIQISHYRDEARSANPFPGADDGDEEVALSFSDIDLAPTGGESWSTGGPEV